MKVFVLEYITGGGFIDEMLPNGLAREGDVMLHALVADLLRVPGVEVLVPRDHRLPAGMFKADVRRVSTEGDRTAQWNRCLTDCDAVWPIAPESRGILERISQWVLDAGRPLLNSRPAAVALAASKLHTARRLAEHGVPVVPTYSLRAGLARLPLETARTWVLKPDDGVGCEGARVVDSHAALQRAIRQIDADHWVVQPYVAGLPTSLSLLCVDGQARLLSCNRQRVERQGDGFVLHGCVVNSDAAWHPRCAELAAAVARAVPGLWGYVGVDLVLTARGPCVLEINPRLTTSYAGLYGALGVNGAQQVLGLLGRNSLPMAAPPSGRNAVVDVALETAYVA